MSAGDQDEEDVQFVMDTCELSVDASRLLLDRCEGCVDEALEQYFDGEVAREELEVSAGRMRKGKAPACQFYWNGRCPKGDKCPLRHGDGGGTQNQLFTGNADTMGYEALLDLSDSMGGTVPTPLHPSLKSRLTTTTREKSKHRHEACPICIENLPPTAKVTELPCSHAFHPGCINMWFAAHKVCPICKKEVTLPPPRATTPPKVRDQFWHLTKRFKHS